MTVSAIESELRSSPHLQLLTELAAETALVEENLRLQLRSQSSMVESVGMHTLLAGGKRLRPGFVAIGARANGRPFDADKARLVGTCMEMIHMATLIHDDVIDNSAVRRGRPTAASLFGNRASILSGDALLAKATMLLLKAGVQDLMALVSEAVVEMAEGEVREVEARGDFDLDERTYLDILRQKTACFISACCEAGAILADADWQVRSAMRSYGHNVGIAFQIVDDLLDYRGDRVKTGKPIATDFREGQATLPLIYLREELTPTEQETVKAKFGGDPTEEDIREISHLMETRGAFARSEAKAESHIEDAVSAVTELPDSAAREFLVSVAGQLLLRQS